MTPEEINKANIDNLTQLWTLMGSDKIENSFNISKRWPNRLWLSWEQLDNFDANDFDSVNVERKLPIWDAKTNKAIIDELQNIGLPIALEQSAMYLNVEKPVPTSSTHLTHLTMRTVSSNTDIDLWVKLASSAFNYQVSAEVIGEIVSNPKIKVILALKGETPVASALLFKTGNIIGLHQLGVPANFQGQGIALDFMKMLITISKDWQGSFITLQASKVGKKLYENLNFVYQFNITTFAVSPLTSHLVEAYCQSK